MGASAIVRRSAFVWVSSFLGVLQCVQSFRNCGGVIVEPGAIGMRTITGRKPETEAVTSMARDHMEVNVKDLLTGGFSVGKVQVDSFRFQL